jgi:hypothetical protein
MFGFDGYQWLRDGSAIAGQTGQTFVPAATDVGHSLSCTVTVTYSLLKVTVSDASAAVTVIAQSSGASGAKGAQGAAGSQGQAGAPGPRGQAGKVELVVCKPVTKTIVRKVDGKRRRVRVRRQACHTNLVSGPGKFTTQTSRQHARLSRTGTVYATGYASASRAGPHVRLLAARKLAPGRYLLTLTRRTQRRVMRARYWVAID